MLALGSWAGDSPSVAVRPPSGTSLPQRLSLLFLGSSCCFCSFFPWPCCSSLTVPLFLFLSLKHEDLFPAQGHLSWGPPAH